MHGSSLKWGAEPNNSGCHGKTNASSEWALANLAHATDPATDPGATWTPLRTRSPAREPDWTPLGTHSETRSEYKRKVQIHLHNNMCCSILPVLVIWSVLVIWPTVLI